MQVETPAAGIAPDFAEDYAAFSAALSVGTLPAEVLRVAREDIFDTLACAIAGLTAPGVGELRALVERWGGLGEAAIWGTRARVPAHHAAWVNGMMSHARDFDDIHIAAKLHAGVSVIPAALAAAELDPGASGADLLAGIVAGIELMSRMGLATPASVTESGYLYTGLYGHFGATAAAARVLRLSVEQTVNALGIALSQAAGTHQVTRDAALTKRMQPGFAAKTGLISVQLSRAGILGARRTFEGEDGLFPSYLHGNYDPARLRAGLGRDFDMLDLSYKAYPCCGMAHTAIDAAFALAARARPERIRSIAVHANTLIRDVVGAPIALRQAPRTPVQAQFSIPFTMACALVNGAVRLTDFTPDGIRDRAVLDMAARIVVEVDPEADRAFPGTPSPVRVVAETEDGRVETTVAAPRGSAAAPMGEADFDAKMDGCLAASGLPWPSGTVARFRRTIAGLEEMPRAADLVALLTPPG